jgi:hypothetical protein
MKHLYPIVGIRMVGRLALQRYDFGNNIGYIINRTAKAFVGASEGGRKC